MNVSVAGMTKKSGNSTLDEISTFSRLKKLLRVTSWVECFLYNFKSTAKDTEWRKGMLSGSEIAQAEQMWIRSSQDELKSSKHYKELAVKLKLVETDGLLKY